MARIGYARVSSTDQDLALQIERLKAAGCEMVRSEKVTGYTRQGRSELASIIAFLRPGDEGRVANVQRPKKSSPNSTSQSLPTHFDEVGGAVRRARYRPIGPERAHAGSVIFYAKNFCDTPGLGLGGRTFRGGRPRPAQQPGS